jgi:3-hydroxyethyl bacteriochlorophyllide a dehydrogenase
MKAAAVVLNEPEHLVLQDVDLTPPAETDAVVDVAWSGVSAGTERLLWSGRMPPFPGMGYPLVPGYESVGHVIEAPKAASSLKVGQTVFVPGARCFKNVRALFGAAASRLVVPAERLVPIDAQLRERGVLLALAATAYHALAAPGAAKPDRIVGHGVLGRLLARIAIATGGEPPLVWERNRQRLDGADGYQVVDPADDPARDCRAIYDVSGDSTLLDALIARLAPGGEIVLAGFYSEPLSFAFPPAFMRELRLRVAAEWRQADLIAVRNLVESGRLSLDGLITHSCEPKRAAAAYRIAFDDPACLKMILDWRSCS